MKYSKEEVIQYVKEADVKFIRLAFCDVFGVQKNISITPEELPRAFEHGIAFDASAISGFCDVANSSLLLHPEPETLALLPWRPEHGRVVRMFANITYPDGTPFECDTRALLKKAVEAAKSAGISFVFDSNQEFYLFKLDEKGNPTSIPYDEAGYMDIAPDDRGENIRREICFTLEQMGISPESSHHEEGPGQNKINFRHADPITAADNAMTFRTIVSTIAHRNGLYASFSAKPIENAPGNGFHVSISIKSDITSELLNCSIAGLLEKIRSMTIFLNPTENSYKRFGHNKAPFYISWSENNRSQLIRVPTYVGGRRRAQLRSPDPTANPYLVFALMIYASVYGITGKLELPKAADINLYKADEETLSMYDRLPENISDARNEALQSDFIKAHIPQAIIDIYCK